MATMYPEIPKDFDIRSGEQIMFEALDKLPKDYHVFHSTDIVNIKDNRMIEHEADFVIFHKDKGILCIEAKNGSNILYEYGEWFIGKEKILMKHGGPFKQAQMNKLRLLDIMNDRLPDLKTRCKFLHAVWFPAISEKSIAQNFPIGADKNILLTNEALEEPKKYIDKIFDIQNEYNITTKLSDLEARAIITKFLCPALNLCETKQWNRSVFNRLLKEQIKILDFLDEQRTALINGIAGTGKTFVAIEKAKRCAENGDKVLFLCFNKKLSNFLSENYNYENVTITHIDKFACQICNTRESDLDLLAEYFDKNPDKFDFKHLIIDEGQDFGQERIEKSKIIQILKLIVDANEGNFYVFYDKNQLIQAEKIPDYIQDADCKLTLYKNCRNTENIAITSTRTFDNFNMTMGNSIVGDKAQMYIDKDINNCIKALDKMVKLYKTKGYNNIVILTCADKEDLSHYSTCTKIYNNIEFTTCRKFKGLEADVIILVDISKKIFSQNNLIFYTGASRARFELGLVCNMNEDDCNSLLQSWNVPSSSRSIINRFTKKFNAKFLFLDEDN